MRDKLDPMFLSVLDHEINLRPLLCRCLYQVFRTPQHLAMIRDARKEATMRSLDIQQNKLFCRVPNSSQSSAPC
jgi:hypothetical protein